MNEKFGYYGKLHYELRDKDGNLKEEKTLYNTVTNFMDAHVADQLSDQGQSQIGFMAVGSGTGQTASSTDLAKFVAIVPLSGNPLQGAGADDNDVIYSAFFSGGVATNDSIAEAGVFQASGTSRTTLCLYNDGLSVNKGADDTLKIDWTLTLGSS